MTAYPCCECCLTDTMHPDQHEVACPTCDNPAAARLRAERGELADKLAHMPELLAAAWDEGHHAGHEDARAVQPTYPDPTPNPYRQGSEGTEAGA